jgi:hypothetical protein
VRQQKDPATIKAEFRRRKLRQFALSIIGGSLALYLAFQHTPAAFFGWIALIGVVLIWSMIDWRCPACGEFLGYGPGWWSRKRCRHYDAELLD